MRTRTVQEVRNVLQTQVFATWYKRYCEVRQAIEGAQARRTDLLGQAHMVRYKADLTQQTADDKLFAAGEFEDLAARSHAEYAEIENDSFEVLSEFELQRQKAIDALVDRDRLEKLLEDGRQVASDLRARLDAARKHQTPEGVAEADRLAVRLAEVELQVQAHAKAVEQAAAAEVREARRKEELWLAVEAAWSNSFRANMARTEFSYSSRCVRAESELLFARSVADRRRVEQLEGEAQRALEQMAELDRDYEAILEEGRKTFECTLVNEFLYWPHSEDVKAALCVPLVDESRQFNIQVSALQVYRLERARGLEFIEPARDVSEQASETADNDPRLEAFFAAGPGKAGTVSQ
ncbi:MAG: hypothetical protein HY903_20785 [Deltaproteobacteria bacterium]|nr:hypothetical protein [Deltaproteobacteria bacterium]